METFFGRSRKSWDVVFVRDSVEVDVQEILTGNLRRIDRGVEKGDEMANDVWIVLGKVYNTVLRFLLGISIERSL